MARMIPARPDPDTPDSEKGVFGILENRLPDDWTVIHSRRIVLPRGDRRASFEGEIDFLVVEPRRGILALEVKGGGVGRDAQGWFSYDRYGERHGIKDPAQQAQRAIKNLVRYLQDQRVVKPWGPLPHEHGVVFPNINVHGPLGPDVPREKIVDEMDLADPRASLLRVFDASTHCDREMKPGFASVFVDVVAPTISLVPTLASHIAREARELVRLTNDQMQVLDMAESQHRVGVEGVAGSGKTLLAMEKARRMADGDAHVLLLCFNQPLAKHLAGIAEGFIVKTFHQVCADTIRAAGLRFTPPKDVSAKSKFFEEEAPSLLQSALERLPDERFDAVIVDEGQDFKELWWPVILELLADPEQGTLYVFYDLNQNLYGGSLVEQQLGLVKLTLPTNCRNTVAIAQHACSYLDLEARTKDSAPPGETVFESLVSSDRAMVDQVRKLLHKYAVEEKISTNEIVVLTAGSMDQSPVWKQGKFGNLALVELEVRPTESQVRFSTIHRFKGLEADVIIVCDATPMTRTRLMHVGTSRARHILAIVRSK